MEETKTVICSFCEKEQTQVQKMIAGKEAHICEECVKLCVELLEQESKTKNNVDPINIPDPHEIKKYLEKFIIGQDVAKIKLSVALTNHFKRQQDKKTDLIEKSNIFLIGPSGTGKTLLAKTIAKYFDIPIFIADATALTENGYVGDDVDVMISRLYQISGNSKEKTERGIIFIDEIDKKSKKENNSGTRDVSGEGVQQSLLKIIEGDRIKVSVQGGRKNPQSELVEIDTKNILFIASGAFVGLEKVLEKRISKPNMGFVTTNKLEKTHNKNISSDDLIEYGLIPEFVGRFPIIVQLEPLNKSDYMKILTEPENSIVNQYKRLFEIDGIQLDFTTAAIEKISDVANESKTGARGLKKIIEDVLTNDQFNINLIKSKGVKTIVVDDNSIDTGQTEKIGEK